MKSVMRCIPHALSHNSYYLTSASIGAWKCNRLTDQPTDEHEVIYTSNNPKLFRKKNRRWHWYANFSPTGCSLNIVFLLKMLIISTLPDLRLPDLPPSGPAAYIQCDCENITIVWRYFNCIDRYLFIGLYFLIYFYPSFYLSIYLKFRSYYCNVFTAALYTQGMPK